MELSKEEKFLLLCYTELFNECYDVKDDTVFSADVKNIKLRHIKMQNACYIFKIFGLLGSNYIFSDNVTGPASDEVANLVSILDQKKNKIKEFYQNYIYNKQFLLINFLGIPSSENKKIEFFDEICIELEEIVKEPYGSSLVANMIYLIFNNQTNSDFEEINNYLILFGYENQELNRKAWDILLHLKFINHEERTNELKRRIQDFLKK